MQDENSNTEKENIFLTLMSDQTDLRKNSRKTWTNNNPTKNENITLGCYLRSADALEAIAEATKLMVKEKERLEEQYQYMREERDRYRRLYEVAKRSRSALRGTITRMKKKAGE